MIVLEKLLTTWTMFLQNLHTLTNWTQTAPKQGSPIHPHSSVFCCESDTQRSKQKHMVVGMSSDTPNFCSNGGNQYEAHSVGLLHERGKNLVAERSDYVTCRAFSLCTDKRKTKLATRTDHNCENEMTTFIGAGKSSLGRQDDLLHSIGCVSASHLPLKRKDIAAWKSSSREYVPSLAASGVNPGKCGVFGRQLLPVNSSTGLNRGDSMIEKYSGILAREKEMDHPVTPAIKQNINWDVLPQDIQPINRFQPVIVKNQNQYLNMQEDSIQELFSRRNFPPRSSYYGKPLEVSNVETMRICATFDSVENTQGGERPPMFSHTTHQYLYTKQTGFNLPRPDLKGSTTRYKQGVTIQPLWSSTDDSEEKGGARTSEDGVRNEASAETKTADMGVCGNKNDISGVSSSELNAETSRKETALETYPASERARVWGKLPITKTTSNSNKELIGGLPCEPRSVEPTTSQTQSLEAEHIFSDTGDSPTGSRSCSRPQNLIAFLEPSSRCAKRLKTSSLKSLEIGTNGSKLEASSFNVKTTNLNFFLGSSQNEESSSLSNKKIQNTMLPWIQRWRVNPSVAAPRDKSQAVVICEPNTSKLHFEELGRKQFPSIGAMALMGKSMNGLRPCELTKKGPLVVWNTKSY